MPLFLKLKINLMFFNFQFKKILRPTIDLVVIYMFWFLVGLYYGGGGGGGREGSQPF